MTQSAARIKLRNILVATDFSPCSEAIVPYAASLAREFDATLYLFHVVQPEVLSLDPPVVVQARDAAERQMQDLELSEQLEGIRHKVVVADGEIVEAVTEVVRDNQIDVILVGTHGRKGIRKLVMGSVAERIFRHAPCPVLILGPKVCANTRRDAHFNNIMFATDFGAGAQTAMTYAQSIAADKKLTLMHVMPTTPLTDPEAITANLRQKLLDLLPSPRTVSDPQIEAVVEVGEPAQRIVEAASDRQTDLIVIGAHESAMLSSHLMDTAYRIIANAPCPVLTIAAAQRAKAAA